jgi:CspA family cold shock protein
MSDRVMEERLAAERLLADRVTACGTVRWFSEEEGYGYICADEGDDDLLFLSASIANEELTTLTQGARVEFEVHEGRKGLEAFGVVLVEAVAEGAGLCAPRAAESHSGAWTPPAQAIPHRPR